MNIIISFFKKILFIFLFIFISFKIHFHLLYDLYTATEVIIPYGIKPFDICSDNPQLWYYMKIIYIFVGLFSHFIILNIIYNRIFQKLFHFNFISKKYLKSKKNSTTKQDSLNLLIGFDQELNQNIYIPEKGLYQNFLITGTIGSGKTSSAMYPFTKQLLYFNSLHSSSKLSFLILDAKGNYCNQLLSYCENFNLLNDLIVIKLNSNVFYNPLHKPNLKSKVLANRLKTILLLFSENNTESYWLDKAEDILCESIKLCRLYNNGYVTFLELHKLITSTEYYYDKLKIIKKNFISNKYNDREIFELNSCISFFENEFLNLDSRTKGILISEITRITNPFVSDYDVLKTFCAPKEKLTFTGFDEVLKNGKIVVLNMNIFEYTSLSKIIATYLKLDFQSEVMINLSNNKVFPSVFICDEYDKFASKSDGEFFSLSREAKCINIISTQSYTSLKTTLHDDSFVRVILQNLINKIWFRTDDIFTIEETQKQLGKEEFIKTSKSISENAKETKFSYFTNTLNSDNSNISETYNTYSQKDFKFDFNYFTQNLETFTALTFLTDGTKIFKPSKLDMLPYFKKKGN